MSVIKCKICGSLEGPSNYRPEVESRLIYSGTCFSCYFWNEQYELDSNKRGPHKFAVIDGTHYSILPDDPDGYFKGHGGKKFKIRFFDGTEVITHNLWCQGDIPPIWKDKFPNNATFI